MGLRHTPGPVFPVPCPVCAQLLPSPCPSDQVLSLESISPKPCPGSVNCVPCSVIHEEGGRGQCRVRGFKKPEEDGIEK